MNAPLAKVVPLTVAGDGRVQVLKQLSGSCCGCPPDDPQRQPCPTKSGRAEGRRAIASCASSISILTALYLEIARLQDRIAVKPHAGPVLYAINYLLGRQTRGKSWEGLRRFAASSLTRAGLRTAPRSISPPARLALALPRTTFSALMADYVRLHGLGRADLPPGRHIAIAGDAEFDEGNIYEALLEGWKHDVRDVWWVVDYNRQSSDSVVPDRLFGRIEGLFRDMGWNCVTIKFGRALEAAFARDGGERDLRRWIDDCPNSLYSALTFQGGAAWRQVCSPISAAPAPAPPSSIRSPTPNWAP